jgi:hypothetical protein
LDLRPPIGRQFVSLLFSHPGGYDMIITDNSIP